MLPPSCRLLPLISSPPPTHSLHVAKTLIPRQTHAWARARPVAPTMSAQLDAALSAGFVRLLNAGQEDADCGGGHYDPKSGDYAVGIVVSGTEARLDVAVGADRLATLLTKELLPLCRAELPTGGAKPAPPRPGSVGVLEASPVDEETQNQKRGARTLVPPGTVVFAEVLGRTLSGRPLLSARRLFRRLSWHRASRLCNSTSQLRLKFTNGILEDCSQELRV
ncbi:unnamed protein product [Triticum turgidum subsp. durum]|uniref:Uncharacterized protein n=1 Tax=Triticum turgidum subsp. durum TaxID=4567 RepID=A0A9R1QH51_TRITD|nr:unnamed protein product [Triticum turgidum subsp. durum]